MKRNPVKSSNVKSIGYDPKTGTMHVEFSGGTVYEYSHVPPETHAALMASSSIGAHFAKHVKPKHEGRKLGK